MQKNFRFKFSYSIFVIIILLIGWLFFVFFMQGIYRQCIANKCVSVVTFVKGRDTYLRVYDQYLLSSFFANLYAHGEYPLETGVLIGKQLEDGKIVVISDVLPKIKGNVSNNLIFKYQFNAYYMGNPNAIEFNKLPHFN